MILRRRVHHQGLRALPALSAALERAAAANSAAARLDEPITPKKRVRRTRKESA